MVPTTISSDFEAITTDAAARPTDVMVPRNMTLGLQKACFGWKNETLACYSQPLNISLIVPRVLLDVLSKPIRQLQAIESTVVSPILETVRRSLVAGIVLLLLFSLVMLFWEFPNQLWKRAIMTPLGLTCLILPFLISTVAMFIVQSDVHAELSSSSVASVRDGDASKVGLIGLVFSAVMFAVSVAIMMI